MKKIIMKLTAIVLLCGLTFPMAADAREKEDMTISIGSGIVIDVEKLAEENSVDPYELKDAILKGLSSEKASPFSDLQTVDKNVEATETVIQVMSKDGRVNNIAKKIDQDATAYVARSGAVTASGKKPTIGMCAMHVNVTTKTGTTSDKVVRLGTKIYMDEFINVNGKTLSSFIVEDRGEPSGRSEFWIDIYWGLKTDANYNSAIQFGKQEVSYSYLY